jgi:hypothetical protein
VGDGCVEFHYLCFEAGNFRLLPFDGFGLLPNENCLVFDYSRLFFDKLL